MSALSAPSGGYPILAARPNASRPHQETGRHPPGHRLLCTIGTVAASVAALALVVYPLVAFGFEVHRVARTLLVGTIIVGAVVAGLALITGLAVRIVRHHVEQQAAALAATLVWQFRDLHAAVAPTTGQLTELGEDLRVQVDRQGRTFTALVEQLGQRLGDLEAKVDSVATAAAIVAQATGDGKIRPLRPPN